jgi:hypothetical protein
MGYESDTNLSIFQKAYRYYRENGILSFFKNPISLALGQIVRNQAVSATELVDSRGDHRIWYEEPEDPITVPDPDHPRLNQEFSGHLKEFKLDRGFVCELQECHLVGENAVGLFNGEKIITESSGERLNDFFLGSQSNIVKHIIKSKFGKPPQDTGENVFPLISPDPSYYHWMLEYLPKLRLLERYQNRTGKSPTILIESDARDFVKETLESAGYGPDRYHEWDNKNTYPSRLVVSSHRPHIFCYEDPKRTNYELSKTDISWLRDRIRSNTDDIEPNVNPSKRIYISRQNASRGRKILNYGKLLEMLQQYGFESYALENYSFVEQVKIFKEANTIIGPHGAGLLNMIFSDNANIVELFPNSVIKPHFYILANVLGFDHTAIISESENDDLVVDIGQLESFIIGSSGYE